MKRRERVGLLDGDIIAYKASFLNEGSGGDALDLEALVSGIIDDWETRAQVSESIVCLSQPSFRYDVFPQYKAHRKDKPKPADLPTAYEIMRTGFKTLSAPLLEADDVMGILATNDKFLDPVIVTIDKDLRGVPGLHCNPDKEDFPVVVTPEQATYNFCNQWLCGDSSDGYSGIPKTGPVKAAKLLLGADDPVAVCLQAYYDAGMTYAQALVQGWLARILTADLYDSKAKLPIRWNPGVIPVGLEEWVSGKQSLKSGVY